MSRLNRLLWTGLVLGVAACGDDVTVPPPAISVVVTPDGASIIVGQTLQMAAAVTGGPAGSATIAWSSSNNATATVSATGLVTAVAAGSVGITATATIGTSSGAGSATVNVQPATPSLPPTLSISTITNTIIGTGEVPVNLAAVAGQINVSLNLERNGNAVARVEMLMDTETGDSIVASQVFSAAPPVAASPELVPELIILSVNTAAFNAATGAVAFLNRLHTLKARAILSGTTGGPAATQSVQFTLANVNTFISNVAFTGTANQASGPGGLGYRSGGLDVSVIPVIYSSGLTLAQGTVSFGAVAASGCDASGIGTRTRGLTAPAAGSSSWTASFVQSGVAAGATNVVNYEFDAANCGVAGLINTGEFVVLNGVDNQGNALFAAAAPAAGTAGIRLDNRAPSAPTFVANPNIRQNGWINATVGLTGLNTSATDNDWMLNTLTGLGNLDDGVGGYTRMLRVGDAAAGTVAAANAAAASDAPALPAPTVANNSLCAVATATDALGNESARPANATVCLVPPIASFVATGSQHLRFGVDIAAPTIAFSGGLAANARLNGGTVGAEFQVTVNDTGAVGNSGMLSGAAVIGNVQVRNAAGNICFIGAGAACTNVSINVAPPFPLVPTTTVAASVGIGYYTFSGLSQDAAGNQSAPVGRVVVYDFTPATATAPAVPVTITGAFNAAAFLNDDLSIRDYYYTVGFGTALIAPTTITLAAAPTVVDEFNSAVLTNTNFAINTNVNTFLGLQATNAGNVPQAYVAGSNPLNALNLFVRDQTQAAYTGPAAAAIGPTAPAAGIAIANAAPVWNFTLFTPATTNATVCAGQAGAPACGVIPNATVLSAVATGTTATFPNPFSRVDFYAANAAGTDLVLIGSVASGSAATNDNGAIRTHTYSLNVTALSLYTALGGVVPAIVGPVNVYAFGVNAAGNVALVSQAVAQTINP